MPDRANRRRTTRKRPAWAEPDQKSETGRKTNVHDHYSPGLADRRRLLLAGSAVPAMAQDKPVLKFSAVFSEQDIRAEMTKMFADQIKDDFTLEPYYGGTLFKQGTELVALQRGNLEMGNIAPQDISNQIPAWSVLTSAYLFRDSAHLKTFFASDLGAEFKKMAEDQLGVHILGPTYFGTRQVGLKGDKKIKTPADMAGIKLRMPGGDAWQFLGTALGANPTPMAYAEVYTGLQTGAIDGQDNPLPNVENMKFYEVMKQIVLTAHLVGYDLWTIANRRWNAMTPGTAAEGAGCRRRGTRLERQAAPEARGRSARNCSRTRASRSTSPTSPPSALMPRKMYLASDLAKDWPAGRGRQDQRALAPPWRHRGHGRGDAPAL